MPSGFGRHFGGRFFGCVTYADDLLLLSAAADGLQFMINICCLAGVYHSVRLIRSYVISRTKLSS